MKSVLITGGTGFFANEFVSHLLKHDICPRVCIFSRDEHKQAVMRQKFNNDPRLRFFIGDVRDVKRLRTAMAGVYLVSHAAELKRIEVGRYNPSEMVNTNVIGAMNVIEASTNAKVSRVVFLSTDKAYQPISAYGQSKALAETMFIAANEVFGEHGPKFSVTRYGNIANSTGSVIPLWREALKTSDTVQVTDPDCTRFYMTAVQAVDLVLTTIRDMQGGELVIPTLPAYRLGDLAEAMGAKMEITGLPDWEKKHESMNDGNSSDKARRMTVEELRCALATA